MATETIDYAAVLSDLEAKRAAIDAAIAGVRQMLNLGAEQGMTSGPATVERREQASVRFDSFFRMSMPARVRRCVSLRFRRLHHLVDGAVGMEARAAGAVLEAQPERTHEGRQRDAKATSRMCRRAAR